MPAIAGSSTGINGMTSVLAAGGGVNAAGANADAQSSALAQTMQQIRAVNDQVGQLAQQQPAAADIWQQISLLLKQAIVKIAQAQQAQTASSLAVPGGGGGVNA